MGATTDRDIWIKQGRVCGSCRWIKGPGRWTLLHLRRYADQGLIQLLKATAYVSRQPYWCCLERCWVHLLDRACSLWMPGEDEDEGE